MAVTALRDYIDPSYKMVPVLTATVIGRGAAVSYTAAGYANDLAAGEEFAGFAEEDIDATGLSSGERSIRVIYKGRVKLTITGADAVDHVNDIVYAADGDSFTLTQGSNTPIGRVSEWISGTTAWVDFEGRSAVASGTPTT